jgi:hypothetical protein
VAIDGDASVLTRLTGLLDEPDRPLRSSRPDHYQQSDLYLWEGRAPWTDLS